MENTYTLTFTQFYSTKKFIQRKCNQNKSNYTLIHFNLIVDNKFCWIFVFPFVYVSTSILLLYHYMYFINEINPKINLISKFKFYSLCSNWSLYFSLFNKNKTKNIAGMGFFNSIYWIPRRRLTVYASRFLYDV